MKISQIELVNVLLKEGPEIADGHVTLTGKPGLGIVVDEDVIKEYRVEAFPRK